MNNTFSITEDAPCQIRYYFTDTKNNDLTGLPQGVLSPGESKTFDMMLNTKDWVLHGDFSRLDGKGATAYLSLEDSYNSSIELDKATCDYLATKETIPKKFIKGKKGVVSRSLEDYMDKTEQSNNTPLIILIIILLLLFFWCLYKKNSNKPQSSL